MLVSSNIQDAARLRDESMQEKVLGSSMYRHSPFAEYVHRADQEIRVRFCLWQYASAH